MPYDRRITDAVTEFRPRPVPPATGKDPCGKDPCAGGVSSALRAFCPNGGRMASDTQQMRQETATLLRTRLRLSSAVLLIASLLFFARSFFLPAAGFRPLCIAELIILGLATAILVRRRQTLTLGQLRLIELVTFGSLAAHVFAVSYLATEFMAKAGMDGPVVASLYRFCLGYLGLLAAYGMFIPNTWQRSLALTLPLAIAPFALTGLLEWQSGPVRAVLEGAYTWEDWSFAGLIMAIGVLVAVAGAHFIHSIRRDAAQVKQMGMYRLLERIGQGGMGEVWKAEHRLLARPAAIKMIRADALAEPATNADTVTRRFEREARATAALRSPHTVDLYDFGVTQDGTFYYVMEYLEGMDLDTLIKRFGPQPAERVIHLLRQAVSSLAEAHRAGLIHRDIKPANLHVGAMGVEHDYLKVLDFGLVKRSGVVDGYGTQLTNDNTTTGTPAFMPPEMAVGSPEVDARTDVYALGCVAYWLLTGQLVFPGQNAMQMIVDHVKTRPAPPSERTDNPIPAALEELILGCLEKEQDRRPGSMLEIDRRLQQIEVSQAWTQERAGAWWEQHAPAPIASISQVA